MHAGGSTSEATITASATNLIVAGAESNASATGLALFLLSGDASIAAAARAEVAAVLGAGAPGAQDLASLTFLHKCYKEALRLYPPATVVTRTTSQAVDISGHAVPAGVQVACCIHAVHRNPAVWERPAVYDPSRFDDDRVAQLPPYSYIPFSAGVRGCPGYPFATMEALVMMACILQQFDVTPLPHKTSLKPLAKYVNWMQGGVFASLRPRTPPA